MKVYIGRAMPRLNLEGSPLGNPFYLENNASLEKRMKVIEDYRQWLWKKMQEDDQVYNELVRLMEVIQEEGATLELECWCAPLPCHGDVIRNAIIYEFRQFTDGVIDVSDQIKVVSRRK